MVFPIYRWIMHLGRVNFSIGALKIHNARRISSAELLQLLRTATATNCLVGRTPSPMTWTFTTDVAHGRAELLPSHQSIMPRGLRLRLRRWRRRRRAKFGGKLIYGVISRNMWRPSRPGGDILNYPPSELYWTTKEKDLRPETRTCRGRRGPKLNETSRYSFS